MLTLTVDSEFVLFLTSTLAHVPQVHKQTRLKVLIYAVISLPADTQLHQESRWCFTHFHCGLIQPGLTVHDIKLSGHLIQFFILYSTIPLIKTNLIESEHEARMSKVTFFL